jgi:hypothetical protein
MDNPRYYLIGSDGRPYGPASADSIRQWLREGRVTGQSPVNVVGTLDWRPLREFAEFAGVTPPPALPAALPAQSTVLIAVPRRTHPLAMGGFLCGLLSLTCCACCAGELLAIVGVILSTVALVEIGRQPDRYEGRGLAIAGVVLGALGLVLGLVGAGAGIAASLADGGRPHRFH